MSNSNNRRSNNRSAGSGSGAQRRTGGAAKKAGAQRSAVKRASEEAAEAVTDADASERDEAPRLPEANSQGETATRSNQRRSASEPAKRSRSGETAAKPASRAGRSRTGETVRRSPSGRNGDAATGNGSRGSAAPAARHNGSDDRATPDEGRPRKAPRPRRDEPTRRPERSTSEVKRFEVTYGEVDLAVRDHSLESLWYEIAEQWGPSDVGPIALVPVPPMTTADATRYAERFVSIGAAIDGDRVKLITAVDLWPSDTSLAREIEQSRSERTAIVLEAPSLNPASIPIIRRCTTVVPVVQLGLSQEDEVAQLVAGLGRSAASTATLLCVGRPKRRRGLARFRRSPKKKATAKA